MENLLLFFATAYLLKKKGKKQFQRCTVGKSGCSLLFIDHTPLHHMLTNNHDELFTGICKKEDAGFGFALLEMKKPLTNKAAAESVLLTFMESMHETYGIVHTTGLETGFIHPHHSAKGVTEYWRDLQDQDWKVKGWTDGRILAVLFAKNIGRLKCTEVDHYLDSFFFYQEN